MELLSQLLQLIPVGKVTTYTSIARVLGTHPRAVGTMLSKNKDLIKVPCHRVVRSDGRIGGYVLGSPFKRKLLELEGVKFCKDGRVCRSFIIDLSSLILSFESGNPSKYFEDEGNYGDEVIIIDID